jgi:hypothetical protein
MFNSSQLIHYTGFISIYIYTIHIQYFSPIGRSVLLVEEPGVPEKTTDLSQVTDQISHNVVSSTPRHERDSSSFGNLE